MDLDLDPGLTVIAYCLCLAYLIFSYHQRLN